MSTRFLLVCIVWWICLADSIGQEWARFRGPNGAGVGSELVIPARWTDQDYRWKLKLPGLGHSSPVQWGQRLFVTSGDARTKERFVSCIDATRGRIVWNKTYPGPAHRQHEHNSWASGTPAVDGRGLYVPFASEKDYVVVALDHKGNERWKKELGPYQSGHGFGSSLIVVGRLVIVPQEHEGNSRIIALDHTDGAICWTLPRKSKMTYATPCLYSPEGSAQLILGNYEHGVTAVDPANGKVLWEIDVFDKRHIETSIASPIVAGDLVLGCSGWLGVRKEVIAVRPPRPGDNKPTVAYRLQKGMPLVPTPLFTDDLLFAWGDEGVVTCADARTGKIHWQERVQGEYYSSPICVGGRLVNVARNGDVVILAASRRFELHGHHSLGEGSHATPAFVGGTVVFRTFHHLMALDCKSKGGPDETRGSRDMEELKSPAWESE